MLNFRADESADSSLVASLTDEGDDDEDFFDFDATRGPKMRLREFKEQTENKINHRLDEVDVNMNTGLESGKKGNLLL